MTTREHAEAIDAVRAASDKLLASDVTDEQRQSVVDLLNAAQVLNNLYWDQSRWCDELRIQKSYLNDYLAALKERVDGAVEWSRQSLMTAREACAIIGSHNGDPVCKCGYESKGNLTLVQTIADVHCHVRQSNGG